MVACAPAQHLAPGAFCALRSIPVHLHNLSPAFTLLSSSDCHTAESGASRACCGPIFSSHTLHLSSLRCAFRRSSRFSRSALWESSQSYRSAFQNNPWLTCPITDSFFFSVLCDSSHPHYSILTNFYFLKYLFFLLKKECSLL